MQNVSSSNSQAVNVPKLRFPGFEEGWTTSNIGDIGSFFKGAPLSKADISENGTPFILYGELYTTYDEVATSIKRKTEAIVSDEYISEVGDVIIPTSGETPEDIATATCVMTPGVILAGDLCIMRNPKIDGRFLSYEINHKAKYKIARIAQGKSIVHIRPDEIERISINYPLKTEQEKILKFLDLLTQKIEKQQALVDALKLYKRGAVKAILSKITEHIKLKDVVEYQSSAHTQTNLQNHENGNYPVYDASGVFSYIDTFDIDCDYIAIIKDGSGVGRVQYCVQKSTIIGTLGALIPRKCSAQYLMAVLENIDFSTYVTGATIPHIYFKDYGNMGIPFPNNNIQLKISNVYALFSKHIQTNEYILNNLIDCKKALLQQMFI